MVASTFAILLLCWFNTEKGMPVKKHRPFAQVAALLLSVCCTVFLGSCGSGAVSSSSDPTVPFAVSPPSATAYSGVPATFIISGGGARGPYQITSSNAALLPVPTTTISETQFVLTPGVVASQQGVTISVKDQTGKTATATVNIQPNFINGDITITGTAPPAFPTCASVGVVCAGQSGTATLTVSQNGAPALGRSVRFDVVQGGFGFPANVSQPQPFPTSMTVTSDETGRASVILRANANASPQIATIRATDLTSGAFRTATFLIKQSTVGGGDFVAVPPEWKINGTFKGICPAGSVDYLVFGGTPPYIFRSSAPSITRVSPTLGVSNPSQFTVSFDENKACGSGYQVLFTVTDATGLSIQPTLTNTPGADDPPAPAPVISLSPTRVTVGCGQSTQVFVSIINPGATAPAITTAIGGAFTTTAGAPALSASVSNNTVTITRASSGIVANGQATLTVGAGSAAPQTVEIFTDGICIRPNINLVPSSAATAVKPIELLCGQSTQVFATITDPGTPPPTITTSIGVAFTSSNAGATPPTPAALSSTVSQTSNTGTITISRSNNGTVGSVGKKDPVIFSVSVGAGSANSQPITLSTPGLCP